MSNINKLALIQRVTSMPLFDGNYQIVDVINCDPTTGAHLSQAGVLSVVFKALDISSNEYVAIKFFDPDIQGLSPEIQYRQNLFVREVEILRQLVGNHRHLQLIEELKSFDFTIMHPSGTSLNLTVSYFVVEWVDHDILDYFYNQSNYSTITKLKLFRKLCLSVFNLHDLGFCHRDLKPENIRVRNLENLDVVILDMGTAVQINSPAVGIPTNYNQQVGTQMYSPIESWVGLSGVRSLGIATDIYSLGCILYELFNVFYFTNQLFYDTGFKNCWVQCNQSILILKTSNPSENQLVKHFRHSILQTKRQVNLPSIDDVSNTIEPPAKGIVNLLLHRLTAIDFSDRCYDYNAVLRHLDSAIRAITRVNEYQERRALRIKFRKTKC
jgi:serine/threonine protein kinase